MLLWVVSRTFNVDPQVVRVFTVERYAVSCLKRGTHWLSGEIHAVDTYDGIPYLAYTLTADKVLEKLPWEDERETERA